MKRRLATCRKICLATSIAVLATSLASCGTGGEAGTEDGERITLIAGHQLSTSTPYHEGLLEFADLVEAKTDGQVTVEIHPNAELGNDTEMFQSLQQGTLDFALVSPASLAEFVPQANLFSVPFLSTTWEERDALIESDIAAGIEKRVEETTDVVTLSYFGGGIRQMFFNQPVAEISDIDGKLFRVQGTGVASDAFSALGLQPTVIAYPELYNALQSGVVDGAENEIVAIESQKFYEAAPHVLLTNHEVVISPLMMSSAVEERLGTEHWDQIVEAGEEAGQFERDLETEQHVAAQERLVAEHGVEFIDVPADDMSHMLELMAPIWESYADEWDLTQELEEVLSLKAD